MLHKMRLILFILVISLFVSGIAAAQQAGGQFCVRAFEDRNGNGLHELDGSEPFLTRGVSAQLLDINNVVVATSLLDNSPTAINGVICFTESRKVLPYRCQRRVKIGRFRYIIKAHDGYILRDA